MTDIADGIRTALEGRYTIDRELGRGGMATVYLAEDVKHHRQVAVKVLHQELGEVLGKERFLREIEIAAGLSHPHILPLYDSGEADGFLFFVMPLAEDESLRERLDREKQLPIDDALRIAREVADALSYAHSHGVVHRDIKPENILLSSGHAVVADFGIARAVSAAGGDRLTETGMAVGTPSYMSPEQAAGERDLDGRSDLYALGCMLYEMLAGQAPFTGPTTESIIHQHMTVEAPAITSIRPAVPAQLAGVLQRAMAKTPADRFSPAAQFAEALAAPRSAGPVAKHRSWMPALVGVGVILIAVIGFVFLRDGGSQQIVIGAARQVTLDPGLEVDPAISPDGQMVAYAAGSPSSMQIYVRQIAGGRPIALTDDATMNHRSPRWSADGSEVAYQRADSTISVASALGGVSRTLVRLDTEGPPSGVPFTGSTILGFDWSRDGSLVAYALGWPGAMYVKELGGDIQQVHQGEIHSMAFSPDGRWLAYVVKNPMFVYGSVNFANTGNSAIEVIPANGGEPVTITEGSALNISPQWMPDGRGLVWVSNRDGARDIYQVGLSRSMAPSGAPSRLTTGLDVHTLTLSRDGTRLVYSSLVGSSNIWAVDLPTDSPASIRDAVQLTRGNQIIEAIDVSRDGQTLVFDSNRGGNYDIYRMAVGDQEPVPLTTDPGPDFGPRISPDGQTVVFHSQRFGNRDIFTVEMDGTNETRITEGTEEQMNPDWSPDGESIVYLVVGLNTIHVLSLADGETRVIEWPATYPRWSPANGVFGSATTTGLYTLPVEGGSPRLLVPIHSPGFGPAWTDWDPDGRMLYYLSSLPSGWSGWSVIPGEEPRLILEFDDPMRQQTRYGFTTDGRKLFMTLGSHESDVWVLDLEER
jgi:Tol biopolymer transport system component/tRNA A-37 threonylcarbamoyl transferase component Bud32